MQIAFLVTVAVDCPPCQQTGESNNCCDMELLINYQLKYNLLMY